MFKSEKAALRVVQEDASRRSNFDCLRIADKRMIPNSSSSDLIMRLMADWEI